MFENSEFFVHNPIWIPSAPDAMEAKDLALLQEDLKKAEDKIKNFYATITGKTIDELTPILDRQTTLTAQEAIDFGFADEIIHTQIKAFTKYQIAAFINTNNKTETMADEKITAELGLIKSFLATIKTKLFKAAMTETVDGKVIHFDGSTITEGTLVFEDEAMLTPLADGDYVIDVATYKVENGVVVSVSDNTEVVEDKAAELEAAKAKIAELEASLAATQTVVAEKETTIEATKEDITILASKVKSFEAMLVTGGNFKANGGQEQGREPKATEKELTAMEKVAKARAEKSSK
jgi:hypothetical protein